MKIICQSCGAKYAIADEKVRGRRVKVRCKSCNEPIIVDGYTEPAPEEFATEEDRTRVAAPGGGGGSGAGGDIWSVNLSDTDQRSMTTQEVVAAWNAGQLPADAFVWREGMPDWVPLASASDLQPYLSSPMSAPAGPSAKPFGFAAPASQQESARISGGRAQAGADLFGNVAAAGSEYDVGPSSAQPASQPYEDQRMTGARNENSVLFSLDALKAGVGPTPNKPGRAPPPSMEKADLDDIMSLGGGGLASPLFGMQQNQALLTAPAPPPDPPPRPPMMSEPNGVGGSIRPPMMMQPRRSNVALFVVAGVVVLGVAGILGGVFLLKGDKGDQVAKAEPTAKSEKTKGQSASGSSDDKQTERPSDDGKGATVPAASGATPAASADKKPVTEEDKKRFAEAMKKDKEEKGKKGEDTKKEEVVKKEDPSSGVASFNKGAAIAALGAAAGQASGCKRPGGPTGSGKVTVTFAPSGRATSANVSGGEFPGTPVGSCVASVFRRASVPPFSGDPVTVSKGFTISP